MTYTGVAGVYGWFSAVGFAVCTVLLVKLVLGVMFG